MFLYESCFSINHVFYIVSKGLTVKFSQKTMFVVVFSDFGGVWMVLGWTGGGHHHHFVVVRGQKTQARVHPQTGQGTLVVVPTDTSVHVWQNGIGQGGDNGMLAGDPHHGLTVPYKFLYGAWSDLKVDVEG